MKDLSSRILKLAEYDGEDKVVRSYDKYEEICALPDAPVFKVGIPFLDDPEHLNGFEGGELVAISGPRKSGKTLLAQTITEKLQNDNKVCMWIQYEVTAKQFFNRFEGRMPFFLLPNKLKMHSLEWVYDRIIEAVAKHGLDVVFIDHLHYLLDLGNSGNVSIEIGQLIRQLKLIAVELEIVIVLMCHMKKLDPYSEPSDADIRDSGFISAESDASLVVWRDGKETNINHVKVCFSRRTGCIEKKFKMTKIDGLLGEYDRWSI